MALTPKDSEAFLREVDDELRRDQLQDFVARYGKLIIAAVVLFLAAVAGYLYWQNHQRAAAEKQAEDFTAILTEVDSGKIRGGDPRIEKLAKDGTPVYRYRYKGSPAYHIRLMAQDVEKATPGAVIEINGYKAVDYRAATETSRRMGLLA